MSLLGVLRDTRSDFSKIGRFAASFIPAAGLTFGLFWAMNQLVQVKEVVLETSEFRPLSNVVLPDEVPETIFETDTQKFDPVEVAPPPANTVIETPLLKGLVFQVSDYGAPVTTIPKGILEQVRVDVSPIGREMAIPIRQPVPDYPRRALERGLEGQCDVEFSIDAAGRPFGLVANCSDEVFARSSVQAVERALFAARVKDGVPVGQGNLVYPIQYDLND